ncbi:hypothetical protein CN878_16390 [Ochrobactrum sp. 695/2009]|nr:hypothetical protein CN881_19895 [Ochrobactrum sp. 721/2009]PJT17073.1 hypothetical protein CN880_10760 [Ochrobactrum sp. 720/2009]PJT26778.1 hypothetical protein CN879_06725 [Ochrobactrum sp. 715/2009]PJT28659.1 hypothetical protein CN878_16390 [Ochrobactrum sp. 695/2009]PJT36344.1 hypothetical protein CN877_09170 [Ochrobactrum sp. 689/2009]
MTLLEPKIIAPDSSHWAKWLDGVSAQNTDRRQRARTLHARLLEQGRIPLLTWHHFEELLGGEDDASARARVSFLQSLPLVAYLRLPKDNFGLGSIVQVLAAEAIAASEGHRDLISIRDRARVLLLKTGTGKQAIGEEAWVWEVMRPILRSRKDKTDMIAALGPLQTFDENRTIGELSKMGTTSPSQRNARLKRIHAQAFEQATRSTAGDAARARAMADDFMARVVADMPSAGLTVRELLVSALVNQGVDEDEIRDECVLADLSRLGVFRSQLRVVASETGRSFDELKKVSMEMLPSRVISEALKAHGQTRTLRPGSDLNDGYLGVLAAYCSILYVDKRTAEDFRRAKQKEPQLTGLIGEIAKAPDFEALLAPTSHG